MISRLVGRYLELGVVVIGVPSATLALACQRPDGRSSSSSNAAVMFALDRQEDRDALVPVLVSRQREFLAALTSESGTGLADFLEPGFRWNPKYTSTPYLETAADANYLAVLGGFVPPSLAELPTAFSVRILTDDMAWVYAELPGGKAGIVTSWRSTGGIWRAADARDIAIDLRRWEAMLREQAGR